ncbi:MAG: hypothetical protein JSS27_03350 [Planctomycetes bacterium]|nr:hypothetical protein [Planctomycetota bacterium]
MITKGYWQQIYGAKNIVSGLVIQNVAGNLANRPAGPRQQGSDNEIFGELAAATMIAIARQDYQFAITLFHDCYSIALQYEQANNCEVHKGAMAFNAALAYLRANDFPSAMHYFELAQAETRLTIGEDDWGVYESDIFQSNFWQVVDVYQNQSPLSLYADLWQVPFGSAPARADWTALQPQSKLLYLISNAERIDCRRLKAIPGLPVSQSFGLTHWSLISNLCRLIETELIAKNIVGMGLRAKVLNGIVNAHSPLATFHADVTNLHNNNPVNSPTDFNNQFNAIRNAINDVAAPPERRIAAAAYLAAVTRNQVQHQVADTMVIFSDRAAATFTVDVLLCLCRINGWAA